MGSLCKGTPQTTTSGFKSSAQPQLDALINRANTVSNTAYDPSTQQQVAGFTAPQNQAFGAIQGGLMQPYLDQAGNYAQQGAGAITAQQIADNKNPWDAQVIQGMIADQNTQNAQMLDANRGRRAAQGALGNQTGADALLMKEKYGADADAVSRAHQAGYTTALGAAQGNRAASQWGAQTALTQGQAAYADPMAQLQVGNQQQAQQQNVLNANTANASAQAAYPFQTTQWLAGILNPTASTMGGTTTQTGNTGPSVFGQVAGAAAAGVGAYMASDERIKHDIGKPIGMTFNGDPIRMFKYDGEDTPRMGVIAQQVEERDPTAVKEIGGIKHVDTRALNTGGAVPPNAGPASFADQVRGAFELLNGMRNGGSAGHAKGGSVLGMAPYEGAPSYVPQPTSLGGGQSNQPRIQSFKSDSSGGGDISKLGAAFGKYMGSSTPTSTGYGNSWTPIVSDYRAAGGGVGGFSPMSLYGMAPITPFQAAPEEDEEDAAAASKKSGAERATGMSGLDLMSGAGLPTGGILSVLAEKFGKGFAGGGMTPYQPATGWDDNGPTFAASEDTSPWAAPSFLGGDTSAGMEAYQPSMLGRGVPDSTARDEPVNTKKWYEYGSNPELGQSLMAAGFGMLASQRPGIGNFGEGALAGISNWSQQTEQRRKEREANRQAEFEAARLLGQYQGQPTQAAKQFEMSHNLQRDQLTRQLEMDEAKIAKLEVPEVVRQVEAMGYPRGTPEHQAMVRKIIEKADRSETEYDKQIAKASAADYEKSTEAVRDAHSKTQRLEQLQTLIANPAVYQGPQGDRVLAAKKIAQTLGFSVEGIADTEAMRAISNQMALSLRSTANGEGMPGAMSDADREFLLASTVGLNNTPAGNAALAKMMLETERYKIKANSEKMRYIQANKSNAGVAEYMTQWMAKNPMLSPETKREAEAAIKGTPSAAGFSRPLPSGADANLPVLTPEQAKAGQFPPGTKRFRGTDGVIYKVPDAAAPMPSLDTGAP